MMALLFLALFRVHSLRRWEKSLTRQLLAIEMLECGVPMCPRTNRYIEIGGGG